MCCSPPVQSVDVEFSRALVSVSHGLIRMRGGHATLDAAILRAPGGFAAEMRDGCNAVNITILLWSAVLVFPAPWKMKALGVPTPRTTMQGARSLSWAGKTATRKRIKGVYAFLYTEVSARRD